MDIDPSRLRRGEYIVGVSSLVLLASLFVLGWYGLNQRLAPTAAQLGSSTSFDGWDGLTHVRWLLLVTIAAGFALVFFQATRRAPAIPVSLSAIVTVLALLGMLAIVYRALLSPPGQGVLDVKIGAVVGLVSTFTLTCGGYVSMRDEGIAPDDAPAEIESVKLPAVRGS